MHSSRMAIGIDFGSAYSCVGVCKNDMVEIIPNADKEFLTPSIISFNDKKVLFGQEAKILALTDPQNTIYDLKTITNSFSLYDLMSKKMNNPGSYKLDVESNGRTYVLLKQQGTTKKLTFLEIIEKIYGFELDFDYDRKFFVKMKHHGEISVLEILQIYFSRVKKDAEEYLRKEVKEAVIALPRTFSINERNLIENAAKLSGLRIIKVISEAFAAVLAYRNIISTTQKNILVVDVGESNVKISRMCVENDIANLRETVRTCQGLEQLDKKIVEYCIEHISNKIGKNYWNDPHVRRLLKNHAERAKRILSLSCETSIEINFLEEEDNYSIILTRKQLELIGIEFFHGIENCLKNFSLYYCNFKETISDVILIGGGSKIPKVIELITNFFDGKKPLQSINPNYVVAYGAAIQAAT